jgi:hypothetical protein
MSVAQVNNIRIIPGTDFDVPFNILGSDSNPASLVGAAVSVAQIGKWPGSNNQFNFDTILTTETGELKIGLGRSITTQLELGRNYYKVELIKSGKSFRVLEGTAIVEK